MKFGTNILGQQRMNPKYFVEPLTFPLAPPTSQSFSLSIGLSQHLLDGLGQHLVHTFMLPKDRSQSHKCYSDFASCATSWSKFFYLVKYLNIYRMDWDKMFYISIDVDLCHLRFLIVSYNTSISYL